MQDLTPAQQSAEAILKQAGFQFNTWLTDQDQYGDAPDDSPRSFTMTRKRGRFSTLVAEVDPDGSVNGTTAENFVRAYQ